ncbi:MAG: nitroreductase family protein [Muribaculum sp.]|nr:nitroreductase family protein [Muribaculum sp.]
MELQEVLNKRRTYRDFSEKEVSDKILKKVISSALMAPTNDHLRQLEFIVVRGKKNIAKP